MVVSHTLFTYTWVLRYLKRTCATVVEPEVLGAVARDVSMEEVLTKAEKDLNARRAQEALESYIQAAIRWPACRELIRPQFVNSLCGVLDEMLRVQGPSSPLFRRLLQSVYSLYSRDPLVVAVLGTKCLKEGALKEAGVYLQAALNLDPCNLLARENMVALREQLVQRWHFRMLNDVTRNSTYFRAIKAAVQGIPDCTVLDIGSGTGILRYSLTYGVLEWN